jgi:hypothetical protein
MRTRIVALAAALIAVVGVMVPVLAQAASTSGIAIRVIYFDSPGRDNWSNHSLNAEWVKIKNITRHRKSLTGWTLRDTAHHVYHFPRFHLAAGAVAYIHTGRGTNHAHTLYWDRRQYVWNNTGDRAILRNANGHTVDRCSYSRSADPRATC